LARTTAPSHSTAGFTLIEVLVTLAIVAISLASIGALIATMSRGTRTTETRLARLETARAIATALPDRDQLVPGSLWGETAGHRWRLDVAPFALDEAGRAGPPPPWTPVSVLLTVHSSTGSALEINTIRLRRAPSQ
jgi:general secretion pathway protein I